MKNLAIALFREHSLRIRQSISKTSGKLRARVKEVTADISGAFGAALALAQQPILVRVKATGKATGQRR